MATTSAIFPSGSLKPVSTMTTPPPMPVSAPIPVSATLSPTAMQNSQLNTSITTSRTGSPLDPQRVDSPALSADGSGNSNPPTKRNAFVHKLFAMLSDPALKHLIWWTDCEEQNVFALHPGEEFATALTNYFKHGNVASFVRQLHMYGFHKVSDPSSNSNGSLSSNEASGSTTTSKLPVWEFKHSSGMFKKNDESSLKYIKRRSSSNSSRHSFTAASAAPSISHNGPTSVPMHASSEDMLRQHSNSLPQYQHPHFQQAALQSPHQFGRIAASSPMQQPQVQPHAQYATPYPYPYIQSPYMLGAPQQQMYTVAGHPMHPSTPTPYQQQQFPPLGPHIQGAILPPQQLVAPVPQAPYGPQQYHVAVAAPVAAPAPAPAPASVPLVQAPVAPQTESLAKPVTPLSQTAASESDRSKTPQLAQLPQGQYQPQYYAPNLQFRKIWETDASKSLSRPRIPSLLLDPLIPAGNASTLPRSILSNYTSPVMQPSEAPRSVGPVLKTSAGSISNVTPIADLVRPSLVGLNSKNNSVTTPTSLGKRSHEESVSSTSSSIFLMRSSSSSSSFGFGSTVSPKPFGGIPSQVPCRNTSFGAGSFPLLNIKSGSISIGPTDVPEQPKIHNVIGVAAVRTASPIPRSESSTGVGTPRVVARSKGFRSQTSSPLSQCHSSTIHETLEPAMKKVSVTSMLNDRSDKRRKVD